jgi:hypothetical protein
MIVTSSCERLTRCHRSRSAGELHILSAVQTIPTALLGLQYSSQSYSCLRALGCFHRSGPTCRFARLRFDRFRRRTDQPTFPTHFRWWPVIQLGRGFWGEPAGNPYASRDTPILP